MHSTNRGISGNSVTESSPTQTSPIIKPNNPTGKFIKKAKHILEFTV